MRRKEKVWSVKASVTNPTGSVEKLTPKGSPKETGCPNCGFVTVALGSIRKVPNSPCL